VGDFNGDGTPDLAVANYDGTVSILLGKGDGTFQAAQSYLLGNPGDIYPSVAVGDFNGDGHTDIAVANSIYTGAGNFDRGYVSVLLGNGDGTFQPAPN
jgi:hypothetical protein